jgi:hypothetical protein
MFTKSEFIPYKCGRKFPAVFLSSEVSGKGSEWCVDGSNEMVCTPEIHVVVKFWTHKLRVEVYRGHLQGADYVVVHIYFLDVPGAAW